MELLNKKILIVDDDEFLLGIYAKNFKDEGFDVFLAAKKVGEKGDGGRA